jgi:hypothetical protein
MQIQASKPGGNNVVIVVTNAVASSTVRAALTVVTG